MMPELLDDGPADASVTLLLAHGAGAGMDTRFLAEMAGLLAARNVRVLRFEFGYMASRRTSGKRRPAPKADSLTGEYRAAVTAAQTHLAAAGSTSRLAIGGKSMGGRVASMAADDLRTEGLVIGLVCLGYPFHPPGTPEATRTAHLEQLQCPTLIVQGERDPFGSRVEVQEYALAPSIRIAWIGDGDHDLGPRGSSGFTRKGNLAAAADAVAGFLLGLA
ncbi:MAG: alpha/beta fold hydrolase [Hyphomicrobiaceae bacterium]|nr:alpha/beta fold hydrolase [Hyphomicrobiaceae bacterium]